MKAIEEIDKMEAIEGIEGIEGIEKMKEIEKVERKIFGSDCDGNDCYLYTIANDMIELSVLDRGGVIQSLKVKDRNDKFVDIVLGSKNTSDYEKQSGYIGAIIGRNSNRLADSKFMLNGREYPVTCNEGRNQLHGGIKGFDKKIWNVIGIEAGLQLSILSKDMEEGYPGNMEVKVNYRLENQKFVIEYQAISDKDTVCNLTQHSYFNLSGYDAHKLEDHSLQLFADSYNPTNAENIPLISETVTGTPFDFREKKRITGEINVDHPQLIKAKGYDHNYLINDYDGTERLCAIATSDATGIVMKQYTNMPSVQLYTGNFLTNDSDGKDGMIYQSHGGFCLETQYVPNAMNDDNSVKPILKKGEWKKWTTTFEFGTE